MSTIKQDLFLLDCATYEDYLDTFIKTNDIRYIRNVRFCHMLVKLGYRSNTEIYSPEQFEERKAAVWESLWPAKQTVICFSDRLKSKDPVLKALADREKPNIQKTISTIVFVKYRLKTGFEVSSFIDYSHSLNKANIHEAGATDWAAIFEERIKLKPKPTDLSYFDWHKGHITYNNSDNYMVIHDAEHGLIFMHKGDHKKICIDLSSSSQYKKNCTRLMVFSEKFGHVVFFDHIVRKKI